MNEERIFRLSGYPHTRHLTTQRGSTLVFVMALAVIAGIFLSSIYVSVHVSREKSEYRKNNVDLVNIAEAGLQAALAKLRHGTVTLDEDNGGILVPQTTLGNGYFEVAYTDYQPGTSIQLSATGSLGQRSKRIDAAVDISCKGIDFTVINGQTVPSEQFTPSVTVLGAAVTYGAGGYDIPVTLEITIGSNHFYPFGSIDLPVNSNVNTYGNPRTYTFTSSFAAESGISVRAKSWVKKSSYYSGTLNSHWQLYREVNSTPSNGWIIVLRNGDAVPNLDGFANQTDVQTFLRNYIDNSSFTVHLGPNDVIYLIEFGSQTGSSADYQDCVVMVSLDGSTPSAGGGCSSYTYTIRDWQEHAE